MKINDKRVGQNYVPFSLNVVTFLKEDGFCDIGKKGCSKFIGLR